MSRTDPRVRLDKDAARRLYLNGKSDIQIALALGCSDRTIQNWRQKNKLRKNTAEHAPISKLAADAVAARRAGVNYGQYKAMMAYHHKPEEGTV